MWTVVGHSRTQETLKVEAVVQIQEESSRNKSQSGRVLSEALGVGVPLGEDVGAAQKEAVETKFVATKLSMGNASESDLKEALGLNDPTVLSKCIAEPMKEMEREWLANASDTDWANFKYVCHCRARNAAEIPLHVRETFRLGHYHGGSITESEYDTGHDTMDLAAFCELEVSKLAGLGPHHVAAIRLYTSDSFRLFNAAMRLRQVWHI